LRSSADTTPTTPLLHHPEYRDRYAANLKRELPRIPFAPDFAAFATAGKELSRLHVEYESLDPWPLEAVESKNVPYSEHVTKMKLSADKRSLRVNESLTLHGIPAAAFDYRLGSRSALEWVIDQYQVKGESDPNREDDPGYIVAARGPGSEYQRGHGPDCEESPELPVEVLAVS